ncbi:fibroblast growth factor-binding protein 1 [Pantherophis guttatus]|uniref:Fibroblast growth factor-binding protein 1 n=1 Tax=Pantherophis guttatus TaxID=94885 RepID=A0A6P9B1A5_PANGU|nr:fibroblast growth factor-binding protein 1 [Pantherophis guttatus]
MKTKYFALLCILMMFCQLLQADSETVKERKRERLNNGRGGRAQAVHNRNAKSQRNRGQRGSPTKGKFINKEKAECSWIVNEKETTLLKVDCKKGKDAFSCAFSGSPPTCPWYAENQKVFWKEITRSLKKQKNLCKDPKTLLKSKVCKTGPPTAHLRLVMEAKPETPTPQQPKKESSDCVEDIDYVDQRKVAEEYCSEMWQNLCYFIISMIQDKKCN